MKQTDFLEWMKDKLKDHLNLLYLHHAKQPHLVKIHPHLNLRKDHWKSNHLNRLLKQSKKNSLKKQLSMLIRRNKLKDNHAKWKVTVIRIGNPHKTKKLHPQNLKRELNKIINTNLILHWRTIKVLMMKMLKVLSNNRILTVSLHNNQSNIFI